MKRGLRYAFYIGVGIFALIGVVFVGVFVLMQFGLLNVRGSSQDRNQFFFPYTQNTATSPTCSDKASKQCVWSATPEWAVIKAGLTKDKAVIDDVSRKTGVPSRILVAAVVPEQIRFFTSEREVFKRYFEPLKILGSLSQFSLGVSGIKQETAKSIEANVSNTTSPYYPGSGVAELVAYPPNANHDAELYARLTNPTDHYYSYLYTALFIKEIESQWKRAGFDASKNPRILVTLFNIGFNASHPNDHPAVGGAPIETGGETYLYGELGAAFYDSSELLDVFPR